MKPGTAKWCGGVGSILLFVNASFGPFPYPLDSTPPKMSAIGPLLALIGYVLVGYALHRLGDYYNDEDIKAVRFNMLFFVGLRRAYAALAARSGEKLFNHAAEFYMRGIVLIIALIIVYIVLIIAHTLLGIYLLPSSSNIANIWAFWAHCTISAFGLIGTSWLISAVAFFSMKLQRPGAAARVA